MTIGRISLLAAYMLVLTACNTNSVQPLSAKEVATYVPTENPEKGYVVGSFSVHGNNPSKMAKVFGVGGGNFEYTGYYFYFRQKNAPEGVEPVSGSISFDSRPMFGGKANSDYDVENGRGHVLVMPLSAGEYEFFDWRIYMNNGAMESSWESREPFSIPFTIEPGNAMYIGELQVEHTFGKNMFGMMIASGGLYTCKDEFDRDLPLIKTDYPFMEDIAVNHDPICNGLMDIYRVAREESASANN